MCIIIVKPKNHLLPSKEILEQCFYNNPHGAGFMYNSHNSQHVTIEKGFMDFESFYFAITAITAQDMYNSDLVLHFRWATQGSINSSNCHPFPINSKVSKLRAINCITKVGIAHNGVIASCSYPNKQDLSDTQIFIKTILSKLPYDYLKNPEIYTSTFSKFAVLDKDGFSLIGNFIEDDGIYYSNDSYMPYIPCSQYFYNSKPNLKRTKTNHKYTITDWRITNWDYCNDNPFNDVDNYYDYYYNDYERIKKEDY